jgi:hypothetical protein
LIEEMFKNLYFLEQKPKQFNQKRNLWELFPCLHMLLKQCEIRFFFFRWLYPHVRCFWPKFLRLKIPAEKQLVFFAPVHGRRRRPLGWCKWIQYPYLGRRAKKTGRRPWTMVI